MLPMRTGVMLVICAPSGTGKTTLTRRLLQEFPRIGYSVSCTTRAPRDGEINGKDYHFISHEAFVQQQKDGAFAEWAEVYGNFYGTPLLPLRDMLAQGQDVLFDIDVQGAFQLQKSMPGGMYVFLLPPSLDELKSRLQARGTESEDTIRRRLNQATTEISQALRFDAWVVNDDIEQGYAEFRAAYLFATLRPAQHPGLLNHILGDDV